MKGLMRLFVGVVVLGVVFGLGWFMAATGGGRAAPIDSLSAREQAFTERMRNVVLVGNFTIEGSNRRDGLPERYEIEEVTKLDGDRWRFDARVTYGDVDVTLPVVVPILWAGDTPMISITDFAIPGLGDEFDTRLVFYEDRYAGTWDHGEYGGMMYGLIEPLGGE